MAKKKKTKADDGFNDNGTVKMPERPVRPKKADDNRTVLIDNLLREANTAMLRIGKLERRIDRIVEAHEKCKSLKNL
ncbi:hypothetical protein LCGC14_1907610 [marine sediment metagenome]|uniref:Uncharacterized protein n=1 Tax=marine sediment metagenome TaxID=412755 RepID=A0A0F9FUL9_9ZZZZ